jgi:hypothetical protein
MDAIKTARTMIVNNKETIKRKVIVAVGTAAGMLIASAVIDRVNNRQPDVIYVEVPVPVDNVSDIPAE